MATDWIRVNSDLNDISDKISEASDRLEHYANLLHNRSDVGSTDTWFKIAIELKNLEQKIKKFKHKV
tara:strand:+ start:220 stop:420 length:201 start_codon:yes stop_codon:yes gene_type:complete